MMQGENIVCFAKDFSEVPTSNNHVMAELAKHNRVLWLNSLATRRPSLRSARDVRKIFSKLFSIRQPLLEVRENLWVHTPLVLPLPHSRAARAINQQLLRAMLNRLRRRLDMKQFQLWTFLPTTADYIGRLGESVAVYYCTDEWSQQREMDRQRIVADERNLCERVDVVFTTAQSLADRRRGFNQETHLSRHGVDHALFAKALDPATQVPADIAQLPTPVIGFYGTIRDWVDQTLIATLAARRPEWSIALIGDVRVDLSRLRGLRNVHVLKRKAHSDLPGCCKRFAVGIIPYQADGQAWHANPIKLREYLSAGLPVVSTPLPEVMEMGADCLIARSVDEFERAIEQALRDDSPELRQRRSDAMRGQTWRQRVDELGTQIMRVKARKAQAS